MTASSASDPVAAGSAPSIEPVEVLGKRQQRAQATAEQLLVAAREVFEQRGYRATTVGAITEAANCAHGTFYLYFKNKEDAFARVMEEVVEEMAREGVAPWQGDARSTIRLGLVGYFTVVERHRGLWKCLMEGTMQVPSIQRMWLDLRNGIIARTKETLDALIKAERIRELDSEAVAIALGSMVEWAAFATVELGEPAGFGGERMVDGLTDVWFNGVYGRA